MGFDFSVNLVAVFDNWVIVPAAFAEFLLMLAPASFEDALECCLEVAGVATDLFFATARDAGEDGGAEKLVEGTLALFVQLSSVRCKNQNF